MAHVQASHPSSEQRLKLVCPKSNITRFWERWALYLLQSGVEACIALAAVSCWAPLRASVGWIVEAGEGLNVYAGRRERLSSRRPE